MYGNLTKRLSMLLIGLSAFAHAQTGSREPHTFLQKHLAFTAADLAALEQGQVIAKQPKASETRELVTFGAVKVATARDSFVSRFRDIVNFKRSANVQQIGKFQATPAVSDLNGFTLDEDDYRALKQCNVADCDLKLPKHQIERMRREINWNAPDSRAQALALFKQMLVDYVAAYQRGGNAALGEYHDQKQPLRLADEFHGLLQQTPYLVEYVPEFHRYLEQYPNQTLPQVENFIYWSKEKFGLKPVLTLTHVTIYQRPHGLFSALIASKQIYASHYYEASLGLTAFVPSAQSAYLLYLNRSRVDALRGWLGGTKRSLITRELRNGTEKNLQLIKQRLESPASQ